MPARTWWFGDCDRPPPRTLGDMTSHEAIMVTNPGSETANLEFTLDRSYREPTRGIRVQVPGDARSASGWSACLARTGWWMCRPASNTRSGSTAIRMSLRCTGAWNADKLVAYRSWAIRGADGAPAINRSHGRRGARAAGWRKGRARSRARAAGEAK